MPLSLTGPIVVRNIMLNWRASVSVRFPQTGQGRFASRRISDIFVGRHALGMDAEPLLDQMVGPESALAGLAVDQRIVEVDDVTRRLPDAWVHQDPGIEADHVAPPVDEGPPPELLDVVLQLDAERAVIPGVGQTAVNIGSGKDESASLGEGDDLVH